MQAQEQPEVDQEQAHHRRHEEGCGLMKIGASDIITHPPDSVESRTVFVGTPRNIGRIQDGASQSEDQAGIHSPNHLYDLPQLPV